MKKVAFLAAMLLGVISVMAQKYSFKAASLNVDGLPPSVNLIVTSITLNPDGPQEAGTTAMSKLIAQKGWDFFGVSENFNYNTELMSSLSSHYNAGTYRGNVSLGNATNSGGRYVVNTDGLNLIWKNTMNASGEKWTLWNERNGYTDQGSDELIMKGYRFYVMEIANGVEIDVYILHMDAEIGEKDIAARESQLNQLVADIKGSNNRRPIIIMGDTNCRYTRDRLKELLVDAINEDPRFTIRDPWVDQEWGGEYPAYPSDALMTWQWGDQKGEVVDKIFYINNTDAAGTTLTAESYLHDTKDFTYDDGTAISDHYPVVVNFTIEKTSTEISGSYYLRNVATGHFLNAGGWWGSHAYAKATGNYIKFTRKGDAYVLQSTYNNGYITHKDNDPFMDGGEEAEWTIEPQSDGSYILRYTDDEDGSPKALAEETESAYVNGKAYDATDAHQKWQLVSKEELTKELFEATESQPKNATFLISGADFTKNDTENNAWSYTRGGTYADAAPTIAGLDGEYSNFNAAVSSRTYTLFGTNSWTLSQTVSGIPNGRYTLTCQAFYRDGAAGSTSQNTKPVLSVNSQQIVIPSIHSDAQTEKTGETDRTVSGKYIPDSQIDASYYFNKGLYTISLDVAVTNGQLDIKINKASENKASWTCFDNFQLVYHGITEEELKAYERVKAAIDDAAAKAEEMGLTSVYDNSTVIERYEKRTISGDGAEEVLYTYNALATAVKAQTAIPADMTYAIVNNSFETGDLIGWDVTAAHETGVADNTEERFTTEGCDGKYLFNTWDPTSCPPLSQYISRLPDGVYQLQAKIASADNNKIFLTANGTHDNGTVLNDAGRFEEASLKFVVVGGTATIGVAGANAGEFDEKGGAWFKADHFRLTRLTGADNAQAISKVRAAIADARKKLATLGEEYQKAFDIADIESRCDNFEIEGDGTAEVLAVYDALASCVKLQKFNGADMTYAIVNNSFEMGDLTGWNVKYANDTGVYENSNGTYTTRGCDGDYLFNIWWTGHPLTQKLTGLPYGKYRLQAKVASDSGSYIFLTANNEYGEPATPTSKDVFIEASFDFEVKDFATVIGVVGGNDLGGYVDDGYWWYKADHFRLTLLETQNDLEEFKKLLAESRAKASSLLSNAGYTEVQGEERTALAASKDKEVAEETIEAYEELIREIQSDITAFTEALDVYRLFTQVRQYTANLGRLAYASEEKYEAYQEAINTRQPASAQDADSKTKAIRRYIESHALAEGATHTDKTEAIFNPLFTNGTLGWTHPEGGSTLNNESFTDGDGRANYSYYDHNGGNLNEQVSQTIRGLEPGRYLLSVTARGNTNLRSMTLKAAGRSANIPLIGNSGGQFGGGWNDTSLEFENTGGEDVTITVDIQGYADWSWFSFTRMRLVKLEETEVDVTIEAGKYAARIFPFAPDFSGSDVEVYACSKVGDHNLLELVKVSKPEANTPYLLYSESGYSNTLSGVNVAQRTEYTDGILVGVLAEKTVENGFVLDTQDDVQAFYRVNAEKPVTLQSYDVYIANPNTETETDVLLLVLEETEVNVTIEAGKYAARIFPFAPDFSGSDVEVYACSKVGDHNLLELVKVSKPEANTPYLLYSESGYSNTLSGVSVAQQTEYTDGILVGVLAEKTVENGFVLDTQDDVQAFYRVNAEKPVTLQSYDVYIANPNTETETDVLLLVLEETEVNVTIEAGKYAARIFPFAPDFSGSDVEVYACSQVGDHNLLELVPVFEPEANTPYLLYSESGYSNTLSGVSVAQQTEYTDGILVGVLAEKTVENGFVLDTQDDVQAFYRVNAETPVTLRSYDVYIINPNTGTETDVLLLFPNDDTGIGAVAAGNVPVDVYSIGGMLIRKGVPAAEALRGLQPGLYIVNGQKKLVK